MKEIEYTVGVANTTQEFYEMLNMYSRQGWSLVTHSHCENFDGLVIIFTMTRDLKRRVA